MGINFRVKFLELETTQGLTELKGMAVVRSPFCACPSVTFWFGAVPFSVPVQRTEAARGQSTLRAGTAKTSACVFLCPSCVSASTRRIWGQTHQPGTFKMYSLWSNCLVISVFLRSELYSSVSSSTSAEEAVTPPKARQKRLSLQKQHSPRAAQGSHGNHRLGCLGPAAMKAKPPHELRHCWLPSLVLMASQEATKSH